MTNEQCIALMAAILAAGDTRKGRPAAGLRAYAVKALRLKVQVERVIHDPPDTVFHYSSEES